MLEGMKRDHNAIFDVRIGREELAVRQWYEVASIANDILIACWFIVGSILFFSPAYTELGTWLFLAGSIELLIRPVIRLTRRIHLQRVHGQAHTASAAQEF